MFILVTGATGAVGPSVVSALARAGHRLRSFAVDAPEPGSFPPDVEVVVGDIHDGASVQGAMRGMDAVVHMAALLHIVDPPAELREKYERINIGGTETVVAAAGRGGVKRIVLFSTISVYGPTGGRVLNEFSPACPDTLYARTKLAAERIVLNARDADGRPSGTVLRLGAVYGPRIKGNYEQLTAALARRRFLAVGNGRNRRTLVHDKDVGRAAAVAVSHPEAAGKVFNVTDGGFHAMSDIIAAICAALGRRKPRWALPLGATRVLAGLVETGSRAIGVNPPVSRAMVDKYTEDCAIEGSRIRKELGFLPAYDLRSGWEETIREMKGNEKGV
jgi:nucleoside-diphosphate-sugar epimerase